MTTTYQIPTSLKQLLTSAQVFHHRIIPLEQKEDLVVLLTDSQQAKSLERELGILLDFPFALRQTSTKELDSFLKYNYRKPSAAKAGFTEENFLQTLLHTAHDFNSSDIHIEAYEKNARVRFRLDGKLKEQYQIALSDYPRLINQIKVMAHLDIAQKRISQDGRISITSSGKEIDIRVSTMPTLYGEKVVLRLLKQDAEAVDLTNLGFNPEELKLYLEGTKKPNGIILISGPTGSGKTTTLYGTLRILNTEKANITTIEDPIEYTLEGINQVQLKEDIGFDFPTALRTFLRQDPDIIMVGEIRDDKTANMAVKAALTGHLVLSTIHTNSAWATISRLIDMGVPPYLLATTINLSVAQRLVRRLCEHCKSPQEIKKEDFPLSFTEFEKVESLYKANGCESCHYTGYSGRKAIYEIIPITKELQHAIKNNQLQIDDYLQENKIKTLKDNALMLLSSGQTSLEEVYALLSH